MHVVIVGGGFAGLAAAQQLRKADLRVTLIDRSNHHLFQPLLYQVATAGLAPSDIAEPIRAILRRQANVSVRMGEVIGVDVDGRRVHLAGGEEVAYDRLVVAAGAETSWFGHDEWQPFAPGLKTVADALDIRHRILTAFERAEWCDDPEERERLMTFAVIGGGATGAELAGAIVEIAMVTVRRDFRRVKTDRARVVLVEGGPDVLATFPAPLPGKARKQLEDLGVEVMVDTFVTGVDATGVQLGEQRLDAATVLWAAGVRGVDLGGRLGGEVDRGGRVSVAADLSLEHSPDVFVVGDLARFVHQTGDPLPGLAPVAQAMGRHAAKNIVADLRGDARAPFVYRDKGSMATIGRSKGIALTGPFKLSGFVAWVAWALIHLFFLVNFRNRVLVFVKWAIAWFTFERASRLIWKLDPSGKRER